MEGIQTVLIRWMSKASNRQDLKLEDLKDSKIFHCLVTELYKSYPIQMVQPSPKIAAWQANYMNFKNIYQAIESFYKNILVSSLPVGLPSVNLLQISKGEDKEGLVTLLIIFFIACINSDQREKYITYIMDFDEAQQAQLMNLIQEKALNGLQTMQDSTPAQIQSTQRGKIDEYLFRIQSLVSQNESLTNQLVSQGQQKSKLRQHIKKLQAETKKIKRQLDQKTLYIHQKQQQQQQQQSSKRILSDSNQQVILLLRKQLVQQQQQHLQQKKKSQDKIQILSQQLAVAQDKISQLQNDDMIGITSNRKIHHQDCVSINQHRNVTQKLQIKLKNLEQKQTELERELLRAKYEYDQLSRKYKKEEKEKENLKVQYEKVSMNRGKLISQKEAEKMKLSIMEAIREKLKSKLQEQKNAKDK